MGTLMCGLFGVCSNGVVASKKLRGALQKLHAEEGRMDFGRKQDPDFFDYIDEQVRIATSQFRDLKKCPDGYRRCAKKASEDEMNGIKKVLDLLILEGNDKEAKAEQSSQPVVPGMAAISEDFLTPVFLKMLQKKPSEPESPQVARSRDMAAAASLALVPAPSAATESGSGRPLLRRQMAQLQLEEDEAKELLCWMSQKVPETKKKRKNKKKQNTGGQKKQKTSEATEGEAAGQSSGKKVVPKRPAAVAKKSKLKKLQSFQHHSFGQNKRSFKHRKTSSAYHSAKKNALRDGATLEEAKEAGKKAMQEMSHKIDSGEVKPPPGQK